MIRQMIPSALTLGNLVLGFISLTVELPYAFYCILLGGLLDVFDGMVARMLNAQSQFGAELDSLADIVTFGVAPAFILYQMLPEPLHFVAMLPVITGAIRLARFNVSTEDKSDFTGLAIPGSALVFLGYAMFYYFSSQSPNNFTTIGMILFVSFLNIAPFSMFGFKTINKYKIVKYLLGVIILVGLISFFISPPSILLSVMAAYIAVNFIYHFNKK